MEHCFHSPVQLQHSLKVFSTLPEHLRSSYPQQLCPQEVSFFPIVSFFFCLSKKYPCSAPQGTPEMIDVYGNMQQGKLILTHVPFLRKPAPAHHHNPLLLGLAPGMFHRINFSYKGILLHIDFVV